MEENTEIKFLADATVGRLAKWLRVLGYDTLYQPQWSPDLMDLIMKEGRILLTRHRKRAQAFGHRARLIRGNQVKEQLISLKKELILEPPPSAWFSRCLRCNAALKHARHEDARTKVPEYVFYQNMTKIYFCPSCGRYFWPGTHRLRMENQLRAWGFSRDHETPFELAGA